jgi:hypothetical protein
MESAELFAQSEKIVMSSLMRVCEKKIEMLKSETFELKAYNALETQETMLKNMIVQFKSAHEYLIRINDESVKAKLA